MILELDISLLKKIGNINLNQLVFLTLVLDKNQKQNQDINRAVSLVSDIEVQELINRNLVHKITEETSVSYVATDNLLTLLKDKRDYFAEFCEIYPVQVIRPDGTTDFLQKNKTNCRKKYNSILGRTKTIKESKHNYFIKCLEYEINNKVITGKMGFMKTMWKWLTTAEWENYEEQMKSETPKVEIYGTKLI